MSQSTIKRITFSLFSGTWVTTQRPKLQLSCYRSQSIIFGDTGTPVKETTTLINKLIALLKWKNCWNVDLINEKHTKAKLSLGSTVYPLYFPFYSMMLLKALEKGGHPTSPNWRSDPLHFILIKMGTNSTQHFAGPSPKYLKTTIIPHFCVYLKVKFYQRAKQNLCLV